LPNTILEALACGIPVIAFSVGGCVELVREGETGMLVKAGDHEQLREAIAGLLGASQLRATMSQACRRTAVEGYGLKIQAARYKHLYDSLLQN
jgi:glycosyltransferase involved in cell wall biosynthesis